MPDPTAPDTSDAWHGDDRTPPDGTPRCEHCDRHIVLVDGVWVTFGDELDTCVDVPTGFHLEHLPAASAAERVNEHQGVDRCAGTATLVDPARVVDGWLAECPDPDCGRVVRLVTDGPNVRISEHNRPERNHQ